MVVAISPHQRGLKKKTVKFGADVALLSMHDIDNIATDSVTYGNKTPFIVDGPGEYEVADLYISGIETDIIETKKSANYPTGSYRNTTYCLRLDGLTLCHLGVQKGTTVDTQATERLGDVDILFIPIGGGDLLDPEQAYALTKQLEPKIVIPIGYDSAQAKKELPEFLKELGIDKQDAIEKLVVKKKDVEGKEAEVIVLKEV